MPAITPNECVLNGALMIMNGSTVAGSTWAENLAASTAGAGMWWTVGGLATGQVDLATTADSAKFKIDPDDKFIAVVSWLSSGAPSTGKRLQISAGDDRRAWNNGQGEYELLLTRTTAASTGASARRWVLGPFESARFAKEATSTADGIYPVGASFIEFTITDSVGCSTGMGNKVHVGVMKLPTNF